MGKGVLPYEPPRVGGVTWPATVALLFGAGAAAGSTTVLLATLAEERGVGNWTASGVRLLFGICGLLSPILASAGSLVGAAAVHERSTRNIRSLVGLSLSVTALLSFAGWIVRAQFLG